MEKIPPEELTLVDDPTRNAFAAAPSGATVRRPGRACLSHGAQERGVLKGFLLSRYPVKGFVRSNGHGRGPIGQMPVGTPGNLFLSSERPRSAADLLARLRAECRRAGKSHGLWVRKLRAYVQQQSGSAQGSIRFLAQVFLVDAESGKTLRVRDLDLVGTPLVMAGGILRPARTRRSTTTRVSRAVVSPSLLLADELQRRRPSPRKPSCLRPQRLRAAVNGWWPNLTPGANVIDFHLL